jgi:hypothetical protein
MPVWPDCSHRGHPLNGSFGSKAVIRSHTAGTGPDIGAGVVPDVGAIATKPAKLDIVGVRRFAVAKHEHQLMLGSVKRAHPAVGFDPYAKVQQVEAVSATAASITVTSSGFQHLGKRYASLIDAANLPKKRGPYKKAGQ